MEVGTDENPADLITKCLFRHVMDKHRRELEQTIKVDPEELTTSSCSAEAGRLDQVLKEN